MEHTSKKYSLSFPCYDLFQSARETFYYYPTGPLPDKGVFAVRHKQYKAHFWTVGSELSGGPHAHDPDCRPDNLKHHNPPKLYDLHLDPSEQYDLSGDHNYAGLISEITQLKKQFDEKMVFAPSQVNRGHEKRLDPCCSPSCTPFPTCCQCSAGADHSTELRFSPLQSFLSSIQNDFS